MPAAKALLWTRDMEEKLVSLWRDGYTGDEIARRLKLSRGAIFGKRRRMKLKKRNVVRLNDFTWGDEKRQHTRLRQVDPEVIIPNHVIKDWDNRCAIGPRSLTAALLGDPLPGYSALDRHATLSRKEAT